MEKDLFPSHGEALRRADLAPRMEQVSDGLDNGHNDRHPPEWGEPPCGCHTHDSTAGVADGCVGQEGCGPDSWGLCEYPLAIVYSPCQVFRGLYDPDTALSRGTLFGELDLPLGGEGGLCACDRACRGERRRV